MRQERTTTRPSKKASRMASWQCRRQAVHLRLATITHVGVAALLVGLVVLSVFEQDLVDVSARVLEQLVVVVENDERDFTVAQDGQLHGLLHQTILALGEGDLAVSILKAISF